MTESKDLQKEIERGESLFAEGKIREAKEVFESLLEKGRDNYVILNNLGVIAITSGNLEEARQYFQKALDIGGDIPDILLNLADLSETAGDWKNMAHFLERYVSISENDSEQLNRLGKAYLNLRQLEKSLQAYEHSLEVEPDQPEIGAICEQLKEHLFPESGKGSSCLNILFVQEYPCIRNYKMAKALRERGHKVTLAYTKLRLSQVYKDLSDETYSENIHLQSHRHLWDISGNYDIIHCHNEPDVLTVAALAGKSPVVHDTHDLISLRADGDPNLAFFEGVANRGASGRIYSTPYQLEEAKRLYGAEEPSLVIYNYVSRSDLPDEFLPKISEKDGKIHIVYEGGIGGSGHRDFLKIFTDLSNQGIHVHIYPTNFDDAMAKFFSGYPNIHYNKPVSPKKIIGEMTQYDFGIIPFNLEKGNKRFLDSTIANKLFEYLAAGLPVIASPLKSYIDFFKKYPVGIVYANVEEIISNLDRLKQMASEIDFSKYVFTYEQDIEKLEKFYFKILEKSSDSQGKLKEETPAETHVFLKSFQQLDQWIKNNGWDGYDPYDIQDYFIQMEKSGHPVSAEKQEEINRKANIDPVGVREQLNISRKRNAKALGLLMSAYVRFYKVFNEKAYLEEAERIGEWLIQNPSEGYEYLCWGYPFDWQSVIFIPRGTPSSVVTTAVGDGLWELYTVTREEKYLNACISICEFITESLNMDDMGEKGVCFSYTPIDDYHVHNANLFCGEFLARVGREVENDKWLSLAKRTADYAISEQNEDGSIFYWGKVQNHYAPNKLDHYHSGFEIRCLFNLARHLKSEDIGRAYKRYLEFYLNNYFLKDGTPKITPSSPYPVNIHGAAEGVLLLSHLSPENPELFERASRTLKWTIENMQISEGWFGYLWTPQGRVDAPFLRWGQAWMLRAFAEYFSAEKILSGEWGYYNELSDIPGRKALKGCKNVKESLAELRELALNYAQLNKGQIPDFIIKKINEYLDLNATREVQWKMILNSLKNADEWRKFVDEHLKRQSSPVKAKTQEKENGGDLQYQFIMPDAGEYGYGSREWAETLFQSSDSDPWGHDWRASQKARYIAAMDLVRKHVSAPDIRNVLDIGCALGDFTKILREYFVQAKILGVDISETAIQKCRKRYPDIDFLNASLPELNIPDDGYDFVSALEVIYYVDKNKIDDSLRRIYEVMKPNGYLLISTYLNKSPFVNPEDFKEAVSKYFKIINEEYRYHGLYSQYETVIRQSMDAVSKLGKMVNTQSISEVNDFLNTGIKLLGNVELVNLLNEYSKNKIGRNAQSHSILLCLKQ